MKRLESRIGDDQPKAVNPRGRPQPGDEFFLPMSLGLMNIHELRSVQRLAMLVAQAGQQKQLVAFGNHHSRHFLMCNAQ